MVDKSHWPKWTPEKGKQGMKLFHDGAKMLARVEQNGMRVDVSYLKDAITRTERTIADKEASLQNDKVFRTWKNRFGDRANLGSRDQLAEVLFGELGYPVTMVSQKTHRPSADEAHLETVDLDFVRDYLEVEKLKKANSTYLKGILRETVDGRVHPSYGLNTVSSLRGSCDSPNLQNVPVRNQVIMDLIRRAFIPSPGNVLLEIDESQIEVRGITCHNWDPVMKRYILENYDYHKEFAGKVYLLPSDEVDKTTRYCGKNMMVFPQFYGSYYVQCAPHLWEAISRLKLKTVSGVPLKEHLKSKGIDRLGNCDSRERPEKGTFEYIVHQVEKELWDTFKVYAQWKRDWWEAYLENGYFDYYTGFRVRGIFERNDVTNWVNQGACFHCLLWSMIEIQKELDYYRFGCQQTNTIHDCILFDCPKGEVGEVVAIAREVMTERIRDHWKWLVVPLEVEIEIAEGSWADKKKAEGL